jgi:putative peptidoglycan lipid II flippase
MLGAGALLGAVAYGVWDVLDSALGRSLIAQILSVGTALTAGFGVYAAAVWAMRLPEALQIRRLLMSRGRG